MTSTFHSLETAKRSLFTQTMALNTTGHNIANANTDGYSRQTVKMSAARPLEAYGINRSVNPGQLGTGVEVVSVERIREQFLDEQFRNENKSLGAWNIQYDTLDKLQTIINEPSDTGISSLVNKFWKAWSDLSKDPENITNRKIVKETTLALTDALNHTSKQLSDLNSDLTNNVAVNASDMNSILSSIADLNRQITRIESLGDKANDLRDQRDLLTDQLSNLVNVEVTELPEGYQITMGGQVLVAGENPTPITADFLQNAYAAGTLNNGEIYGMIYSRDTYVRDYQNQLDQFANTLVNGDITVTIPAGAILPEGTVIGNQTFSGPTRTLATDLTVTIKGINALHKLGYSANDGTPVPGGDFFAAKDGGTTITAGNITMSQAILDDPSLIATSLRTTGSGTTETVVKGNNGLALIMADLKDVKFTFGGGQSATSTIDDYFKAIVGQVGVQANEAKRQADNALILTDQVNAKRQSVSGVSLDEEMSNMMMFQHAYSAAARFMTTFDEVLNKLINGTGVVGR